MATDFDEHEVVWDRYRPGPLAGMTLAKAKIANEVLWGHPVRVLTHKDLELTWPNNPTPREMQVWRLQNPGQKWRPEGEFGIFCGFRLPGTWGDALESAFDLRIATSVDDPENPTRANSGASRVMGMGVIAEVNVVGPEWGFCADCCCWRPKCFLRERASSSWDWDWIEADAREMGDDGLIDHYHATICREECQ